MSNPAITSRCGALVISLNVGVAPAPTHATVFKDGTPAELLAALRRPATR
jgi:hypothetical protein